VQRGLKSQWAEDSGMDYLELGRMRGSYQCTLALQCKRANAATALSPAQLMYCWALRLSVHPSTNLYNLNKS